MFLSLLIAAGAEAATITNTDPAPVVVVVTEGGNRVEVVVDAGASETLCAAGCFMTTPDGDRIGLGGGETIEIVKGSAIIK
ncbi:putative cupin superfamily protein [Rhizobium mongolense]|uniref:Putative cupin superfamily protein n=2 Tax=Rhizobium mongolense TaxID=57676 RepID=A0A7W6WC21_9HYPH|nr:putative cupin superfamily protein [Rhizobium mongolense]